MPLLCTLESRHQSCPGGRHGRQSRTMDGGDIGCRYTPEMIEILPKALRLRAALTRLAALATLSRSAGEGTDKLPPDYASRLTASRRRARWAERETAAGACGGCGRGGAFRELHPGRARLRLAVKREDRINGGRSAHLDTAPCRSLCSQLQAVEGQLLRIGSVLSAEDSSETHLTLAGERP